MGHRLGFRGAACAFLLSSAVAGCVTARPAPIEEATAVAADASRRTAVPIRTPGPEPEGGAPSPEARALLSKPLTEDAAVKVAVLENRSVPAGYERLGVARADLVQAGLLANPVFTWDLKAFSAGNEVEIGLSRSFLDVFLIPLRRRVAAADLAATEASVTRDLVGLVFDVRRAFVTARSAESVVATARENLRSAESSFDLMKGLSAAGNVVDPEVTLAEMLAGRARLDLEAAEADARDAREPMNVLLGLRRGAIDWTIDGALPPLPEPAAGDVESSAVANSLELAESRARIESAARSLGLLPAATAMTTFDLGVVGKREATDGSWGFGPDVAVTLPIFDTGNAARWKACAEVRERVARHAERTVEVESAARRYSARASALARRAKALEATWIPLHARHVEETTRRYRAMQVGPFEVLEARRREIDARREHAETVRDAWLARLDLDELLAGRLDPAHLPPSPLPAASLAPAEPKGR